jgi:hypothetical protein
VHEHDSGLIKKEMVMKGGDIYIGLRQRGDKGVYLLFQKHDVPHDHHSHTGFFPGRP